MEKKTQQDQGYECEVCGATSEKAQSCCGKPMKKSKKSSLQNRTEGFYTGTGKDVSKKKPKTPEVSRFINEGNPDLKNPEQQDDLS